MTPRVSVVITCFNLGRYLDEAVESVLSQTFQDFDVVIVDDGSTDIATCEMLANYNRPRTRVVHSENRGLPGARNLGIRHSAGVYLCCLDADDRLEPTCLEKAVRVLDEQPPLTFASHWLRTFGDEQVDWTPTECDLRSMLMRNQVNGAALVRREVVLAVGGFDETMIHGCEDWDLWLTLLERGYSGTIIPEILFFYRRRHDSMSRLMMNGDTHNLLFRRLIEKHSQAYREHLPELVDHKESDIAHLIWENRRLECDVEHLRATVERRREVLRSSRSKVASINQATQQQAAMAALTARAEELSQTVALLDRDRALLHRDRAQLQDDLSKISDQLSELQVAHRVLEAGHESLRLESRTAQQRMEKERAQTGADLRGLRDELTKMYESASWRITAPLRTMYGWMLRLRNRE